jgi:hypothetical protein
VHYRRQLALQEAKAWAEAHQGDALRDKRGRRLPAEIQGVRIKGVSSPSVADGRTENLPWRHVAQGHERSQRTRRLADGTTLRTVSPHSSRETGRKAAPSDGTQAIGYREHEGQTPEQVQRETQLEAFGARRQAASELARYGGLVPRTIVLGQPLPKSLELSRPVSRQTRVVRLSALDRVQEDSYTGQTTTTRYADSLADRTRLQRLAAQELEEALVLHLTEKETRALKLRAEGLPQDGGKVETLRRAQRKAQAALKGL